MENIIKQARVNANLTKAEMSRMFEIPYRTLENWENGSRKPPNYVVKLVVDKLKQIENSEK